MSECSSGWNVAVSLMSERLRSTYSRFSALNASTSRCSWPKARTTRTPARFSCTRAESWPNLSCTALKRTWMRAPKNCTSPAMTGTASSAMKASAWSMRIIITNAPTTMSSDEAECMTAGPISIRTEARSFVARDIRSPVRCPW